MTINLLTSIEVVPVFSEKPLVNLSDYDHMDSIQNELNRIYFFGFVVLNFMLTISIEKVSDWIFYDETYEGKRVDKAFESEINKHN